MLLYQLLRPLAYMYIRDASKWKIDVALPVSFGVGTVLLVYYLPERPVLSGRDGILSLLTGLVQILPGFYLTALAAVATFNRPDMDELLPAPAPRVEISIKGKTKEIELTRRRMLSMLFGYLTFLSLFIYVLSIVAHLVTPSVIAESSETVLWYIQNIFIFVYAALFWQMIFITLFGLYQLADRMHQPD